jgi:hypothetical protein
VEQSFCYATKSLLLNGLDDLAVKWDMSKLTSTTRSEESEHFLQYFVGLLSA